MLRSVELWYATLKAHSLNEKEHSMRSVRLNFIDIFLFNKCPTASKKNVTQIRATQSTMCEGKIKSRAMDMA